MIIHGWGNITEERDPPAWLEALIHERWNAYVEDLRDHNDNKTAHHMPWYVPNHDWAKHDYGLLSTKFYYSEDHREWAWYAEFASDPALYVGLLIDAGQLLLADEPTDETIDVAKHHIQHIAYSLNNMLLHHERLVAA